MLNATQIIGSFKNHSDAIKAARKAGWKNGACVIAPPDDIMQTGKKRKDWLVVLQSDLIIHSDKT